MAPSARLLGLVAALAACDAETGKPPPPVHSVSRSVRPVSGGSASPPVPTRSAAPGDGSSPPEVDCDGLVRDLLARPGDPGVPALDATRHRLFAAVKGEPVWFRRAPTHDIADDPGIIAHRRLLARTRFPGSVITRLLKQLAGRRDLLRRVVLREGYLYAEDEILARALVATLRLEHLFDEPEVWIQRGEAVATAKRSGPQYVYTEGAYRGRPVRLLLFDRVGAGPIPEPLHLDVRSLRHRLHFDRIQIRHASGDRVLGDVHYGSTIVPTVLSANGARLGRVCEVVAPDHRRQLESVRTTRGRVDRAFRVIQETIVDQIDDGLPFDEPRREVGQEDGRLRSNWVWAYRAGRSKYRFHNVEYPVFDDRGRPLVPEVCVDFLLDTFERASGTWWRPKGEARELLTGRVSFEGDDRETLRRVPGFVEFAQSHPEWFEVLELPERDRTPLLSDEHLAMLRRRGDDFRPADMVFIGGRVPWDETTTVHYHSFFVFESDPITGMPVLLAGNPGAPRLVPWQWESRRTPKRTIRYRVRPTAEFLERVVGTAMPPAAPPHLSVPPR